MRIVILDLGAGNLHSLAKAFDRAVAGAQVSIEEDAAAALSRAELLALPGVGAFGPAAARLAGAREPVRDAIASGLPTIGVCLGMQLLFDGSDEGPGQGLGVIPGRVQSMRARRLPHMGWSALAPTGGDKAFAEALPAAAYFAHSFACHAEDPVSVLATTEVEGDAVAAVVGRGRAYGCQFHPEKSSREGIRFLGWLAREVTR